MKSNVPTAIKMIGFDETPIVQNDLHHGKKSAHLQVPPKESPQL